MGIFFFLISKSEGPMESNLISLGEETLIRAFSFLSHFVMHEFFNNLLFHIHQHLCVVKLNHEEKLHLKANKLRDPKIRGKGTNLIN